MTSPSATALTHAYLDPVSWLAAAQVMGAVGAWLALRWRRIRRRLGKATLPVHVVEVSVAVALERLSMSAAAPRLVIAIEGPRDWPYLEPYLRALARDGAVFETWLISLGDLPDLAALDLKSVHAVFDLSPRQWRRVLGALTHATVFTTLTDLGSAFFPRGGPSVTYAYAFHSLVSTRVAYPACAFDDYDLVLSPTPQHTAELRARERAQARSPKVIIEAGYPYVDLLAARMAATPPPDKSVVIAPSWSSDAHYLTTWLSAARAFTRAGWTVTVRPHPETLKRSPVILQALEAATAGEPAIQLDRSAGQGRALPNAALLVSDWSGAAIEFALAGRQVAFVDTPRKVRNSDGRPFAEAHMAEDALRAAVGLVVAPQDVAKLPAGLADSAGLDGGGFDLNLRTDGAEVGARALRACLRGDVG